MQSDPPILEPWQDTAGRADAAVTGNRMPAVGFARNGSGKAAA